MEKCEEPGCPAEGAFRRGPFLLCSEHCQRGEVARLVESRDQFGRLGLGSPTMHAQALEGLRQVGDEIANLRQR